MPKSMDSGIDRVGQTPKGAETPESAKHHPNPGPGRQISDKTTSIPVSLGVKGFVS